MEDLRDIVEYIPHEEEFEKILLESTIDSVLELRVKGNVSSYLCRLKESTGRCGCVTAYVSVECIKNALPEVHNEFVGIQKKRTQMKKTNAMAWSGVLQKTQKRTPEDGFGVEGIGHVLKRVKRSIQTDALSKYFSQCDGQQSKPVDGSDDTMNTYVKTTPDTMLFYNQEINSYTRDPEEVGLGQSSGNSIMDNAVTDSLADVSSVWDSNPSDESIDDNIQELCSSSSLDQLLACLN